MRRRERTPRVTGLWDFVVRRGHCDIRGDDVSEYVTVRLDQRRGANRTSPKGRRAPESATRGALEPDLESLDKPNLQPRSRSQHSNLRLRTALLPLVAALLLKTLSEEPLDYLVGGTP